MEEHGPRASTSIDEETLWQLNLRENECVENGSYPKRPGEPDCSHYTRTGLCRFGMTCRFNHPPNRKLGEPLCVFYSHYGIFKFGPNCKFDHLMETSMGGLAYSLPTSSSLAVPPVQRLLGSSMSPRSGSRQITSEDENIKSDS